MCYWTKKIISVEFLSQYLLPERVKPLNSYLRDMESFGASKNVEDLQSFLLSKITMCLSWAWQLREGNNSLRQQKSNWLEQKILPDWKRSPTTSGDYNLQNKKVVDNSLKIRGNLFLNKDFHDNIMLRGTKIVTPLKLRNQNLKAAYQGYTRSSIQEFVDRKLTRDTSFRRSKLIIFALAY